MEAQSDSEYLRLNAKVSPSLALVAWLVSFLGAVCTSQVLAQSQFSVRYSSKIRWILLASTCFGLSSIWSLHFIALLSQKFPVPIHINPILTVASACIAVIFTFLSFGGETLVKAFRRKRSGRKRRAHKKAQASSLKSNSEAGSLQPLLKSHGVEGSPHSASASTDSGDEPEADDDYIEDLNPRMDIEQAESPSQETSGPVVLSRDFVKDQGELASYATSQSNSRSSNGTPSTNSSIGVRPELSVLAGSNNSNSYFSGQRGDFASSIGPSASRSSSGTAASSISDGSTLDDDYSTTSNSQNSGNSLSLGGLGLSRAAKQRLKKRHHQRNFFVALAANMLANLSNPLILSRSAIWAAAICSMHYTVCFTYRGMLAMQVEEGYIRWNGFIIFASYVVAFLVCTVASSFLQDLETRISRQLLFAFFAATGVAAMHYTGASAATYYSKAPQEPSYLNAYSMPLLVATVGCSILTCMVSNLMVSSTASMSRDKLIEIVMTKRRLWRVLAQKDAAEQAAELKSNFISVASHEIRTPLHTVAGYSDLLDRTTLTDEQKLYLVNIQRAVHTIQLITRQVLDYSRMERTEGESDLRPSSVNIRDMLMGLSGMSEYQPRDFNHVSLLVYVSPEVPETTYLDETYLTRTLMNLLSNAKKFTVKGYVLVDVQLANAGQELMFAVSDTGIGIPAKFQSAVFEAFSQADQSLTRPHSGTGLGLAIAKQLTNRLGGSLEVDSTEGEGTTFTVRIPLAERVQQPLPEVEDDVVIKNGERILPLGNSSHKDRTDNVSHEAPQDVKDSVNSEAALPTNRQLQNIHENGGTDSPGHERLARQDIDMTICASSPALRSKLAALWRRYDFKVLEWDEKAPSSSKPLNDADIIFIDFAWIQENLNLLETILLTKSQTEETASVPPRPIVCLPYNDLEQFAVSPKLMLASNVLKLKQPLIFHKVLQLLNNPLPYLSPAPNRKDRLKLVRFASTEPEQEPDEEEVIRQRLAHTTAKDAAEFIREINDGIGIKKDEAATSDGQPVTAPDSQSNGASDDSNTSPAVNGSRSSPLVLLVEDNPVNQRLGARILAKLNYDVKLASNGQEAVDMVQLVKPDVVLMDFSMPVMNGLDATRCIRAMEADGRLTGKVPIIALTANVSEASELECMRAGMQAFLSKPLLINELQKALKRHLQPLR